MGEISSKFAKVLLSSLVFAKFSLATSLFYSIIRSVAKNFSSKHLFADVISVHNGNTKHARAIEFDYTNLLAMLYVF